MFSLLKSNLCLDHQGRERACVSDAAGSYSAALGLQTSLLGKEPQSEIPGNQLILGCHLRGVHNCSASFGMKESLRSGRKKYTLNVEVTAGKWDGFQGEGPKQGSKNPESVPMEEEVFCFLSLFVFN